LNKATQDDLRVIEEWRAAHRAVLNTFQAILRNKTKSKKIIVAQRHKRRNTIFNKLIRLPKMELSRMNDVAGCRIIFQSVTELNSFRENFHKARFKHKRRNETDKYDYIKKPKITGYRGIHDVYSYDVNSTNGKQYEGLLLEIQYRTLIQHAWATAVEVIGFITVNQPKFQQGDKRYEPSAPLFFAKAEMGSNPISAAKNDVASLPSAACVRPATAQNTKHRLPPCFVF